jgi:NAD(P)H-hydrate epimerase
MASGTDIRELQKGWVLTREQVRAVDRRAIEHYGVPGIVLMENAGRNAANLILGCIPPHSTIAVVCGAGNNGGDGFVIARHLANAGHNSEILLAADRRRLAADAAINYSIAERMSLPIYPFGSDSGIANHRARLSSAGLIVDALLGTGFSGAVRPPLDGAIEAINSASGRVVAVDVPSGLDCDTGQASDPCVRAWRTITFVATKAGFAGRRASEWTGEVFVVDIGAPLAAVLDVLSPSSTEP